MSIKYYCTTLTSENEGSQQYRLFAIIEDSWYWAIEWTSHGKESTSILTDFNTGFLSVEVRNSLKNLRETEAAALRARFGTFADYIERAVSGFRSYITWICPDPQMSTVAWEISSY